MSSGTVPVSWLPPLFKSCLAPPDIRGVLCRHRDLANGFLVAEIFSRYYEHEVHMHSFENMCNTEQKIDNWAQLSKFFSKMNIPIAQQLIDDVISCKAGAAAAMIEAVYTILTGKTYARKL